MYFFVNNSVESHLLWCSNSLMVRPNPINGVFIPDENVHQRPYYQETSIAYYSMLTDILQCPWSTVESTTDQLQISQNVDFK